MSVTNASTFRSTFELKSFEIFALIEEGRGVSLVWRACCRDAILYVVSPRSQEAKAFIVSCFFSEHGLA